MPAERRSPGLLGDTAGRDYTSKLNGFNAFAAPELRRAIADLGLRPGMRVLDAGCGTGDALEWLWQSVQPGGDVVGIDLSRAHALAARKRTRFPLVLQADLLQAPLARQSFDRVWCVNTIHHLHEPLRGIQALAGLTRDGGRIVLAQSCLVPDMHFAWDARLERVANEAVRQYYRDRYGLDERGLTAVRSIVGLLRKAGLHDVSPRTVVIERFSPLSAGDEAYLLQTVLPGSWGEQLRPYLSADDFSQLVRLCDPAHEEFALRRADFHFIQTLTLACGTVGTSRDSNGST